VGRLQPEKDAATFIEAAWLLARTFPDARFVIAGDGPQAADLRRRTTHRRLDDRVVFTGFVPDGTTLIRHLDLLVVPSLSEGTPLVVLEAMANGVAVVASRVGGIPDQVRHEREALLVEPGDHHAVAEACTRLLTDHVLRRDLTQRARVRLSRVFSPTRRLDQLQDLYGDVLAQSTTANLRSP
jgi:glycosyltransferase involved in cell wall biosynthesis